MAISLNPKNIISQVQQMVSWKFSSRAEKEDRVFDDFIKWKVSVGVAKATLDLYKFTYRRLTRWIAEHEPNSTFDVGPDLICKYYTHLRVTDQLSDNSLATYDGVLRDYFKFSCDRGYRKNNPMDHVQRIRARKQATVDPYSPDEIKAILNVILQGNSQYKDRNACIVGLLWDCHARIGGVLGLTRQRINREQRVLILHEKGDKYRSVTYGKTADILLSNYLEKNSLDSKYLFPSRQGGHISHASIWRVVRDACVEAGIQPRRVLHNFRGSSASDRLLNDPSCDLPSLQAMLGHTDLKITNRFYVKNALPAYTVKKMSSYSPLDALTLEV